MLAKSPHGLTVSEIGERLELPKTSAFDIVQTLKTTHFLREEANRYFIGFMANEVGLAYAREKELYGVAKKHVVELAEELKMAGSLVVYENNGLDYVLEHVPEGAIITPAATSGKNFMHASGSAKVLISYMTEARQKKALAKLTFTPFTHNTILTLESFKEELIVTKKRGYGVDKREWHELVTCVSVPIFSHKKVVAALTLSGLQIDEEAIPGLAKRIRRRSELITEELE